MSIQRRPIQSWYDFLCQVRFGECGVEDDALTVNHKRDVGDGGDQSLAVSASIPRNASAGAEKRDKGAGGAASITRSPRNVAMMTDMNSVRRAFTPGPVASSKSLV